MRAKIERWVEKNEWWVFVLLGVVVLRIPSLFEPYWYGDEGIYLSIGKALNQGAILYKEIHDNKPPLLYLAAALAGGNQFWFRIITLVFNVSSIFVFAKLAERLFAGKPNTSLIAVWIFALLTTIPFWEGNIGNAELFFLLPNLIAMYLLVSNNRKLGLWRIGAAGLMFGVGGLFKMPALLELGVWPLFWLRFDSDSKSWFKKTGILVMGAVIPLLLSYIYYQQVGAGSEYLKAAWLQNIPYLSSWKSGGGGAGIYSVSGRAIAAAIMLAVITGLAKTLGRRAALVCIWGVIGIFSVLLSGRPYPHYLLQMTAVVAIAITMIGDGKFKEKLTSMVLLGVLVISIIGFKFYFYPTTPYYKNFLSWVWGRQTKEQYFVYFGANTGVNYEIASTVKAGSTPEEKIFVWGDQPVIYALSERLPATKYIVKYHILDFKGEELTISQLKDELPRYIINYENQMLPGMERLLNEGYMLEKTIGNIQIFRLSQVLSRWHKL